MFDIAFEPIWSILKLILEHRIENDKNFGLCEFGESKVSIVVELFQVLI